MNTNGLQALRAHREQCERKSVIIRDHLEMLDKLGEPTTLCPDPQFRAAARSFMVEFGTVACLLLDGEVIRTQSSEDDIRAANAATLALQKLWKDRAWIWFVRIIVTVVMAWLIGQKLGLPLP
jgi:hypothetical protein